MELIVRKVSYMLGDAAVEIVCEYIVLGSVGTRFVTATQEDLTALVPEEETGRPWSDSEVLAHVTAWVASEFPGQEISTAAYAP